MYILTEAHEEAGQRVRRQGREEVVDLRLGVPDGHPVQVLCPPYAALAGGGNKLGQDRAL